MRGTAHADECFALLCAPLCVPVVKACMLECTHLTLILTCGADRESKKFTVESGRALHQNYERHKVNAVSSHPWTCPQLHPLPML